MKISRLSFDYIRSRYDRISETPMELSEPLRKGLDPNRPGQSTYDYVGLLDKGWEWIFSEMRVFQPLAYEAMEAGNPRLLVGERLEVDRLDPNAVGWSANAFIEIRGRIYVIHPSFPGHSIEEIGGRHPCYSRYMGLPEGIAKSYYARIEGLEVARKLPLHPMECRGLPASIYIWARADSICLGSNEAKKDMIAFCKSVLPINAVTDECAHEGFHVFLDSRSQDEATLTGDFLLVNESILPGLVFHVADGDFLTASIVDNPVRMVDEYVSHVFSAREGAFSFKKFTSAV